ncbi:hypothetical protein SASPL_129927 [Salvia splendens]|uniref:Protein TAR1 n=1 Tax=Salvia splendens TaxID=180675 RepID=A0A8X8XH06_SALSN|nr:hypothetical protein SASPL_129927 [Salvia splendens]
MTTVLRLIDQHPLWDLDERFARQYRCGPPPEFPLASPRSGIVHHLSGPDRYALTRTLHRRSGSVGGATPRGSRQSASLRLTGQHREHAVAEARTRRALSATIAATAFHEHINCPGFGRRRNPRWSVPRVDRRTGSRRSTSDRDTSPAPIRFPPDNFKHSLTLFSKSFSSFPRGTCSLSVSRPYLALDGIYRPIGAAFPNNPTRRQRLVMRQGPGTTGLSPSPAPLSRGLEPGPSLRTLLQTTIRTAWPPDSQVGLFPVRSPLLRESLSDTAARRRKRLSVQPPLVVTRVAEGSHLGQPHGEANGRPISAPRPGARRAGWGATRCVTPRQTCPRPNGFGRNLRSKTRWFTGFCNSHQVSHFATFFIDARAEISVAESRYDICIDNDPSAGSPTETLLRLLLPLNDKVQWTSRDVAGGEPPTSPRSEHFTGPFNRPVIASNFRGLKGRSPSKKLAAEGYLRIAS